MSDGYLRQRQIYGNYSGSLSVTSLTGQTTLVTAKPAGKLDTGYSIFVQRVKITVTGALAGATWSVQDSTGVQVTGNVTVASAPAVFEYDFGPEGFELSTSANLVFVPSATGASGIITWDATQKLNSLTSFGG